MDSKCTARNKDGAPCCAAAWKDGQCRWRHPDLEQQRAEGRRRGGMAKSNKARAAKAMPAALTSEDLLVTLTRVIKRVEDGDLEPGVLTAISGAARTMAEIRKSLDVEELTRRLDEMEAMAARGRIA